MKLDARKWISRSVTASVVRMSEEKAVKQDIDEVYEQLFKLFGPKTESDKEAYLEKVVWTPGTDVDQIIPQFALFNDKFEYTARGLGYELGHEAGEGEEDGDEGDGKWLVKKYTNAIKDQNLKKLVLSGTERQRVKILSTAMKVAMDEVSEFVRSLTGKKGSMIEAYLRKKDGKEYVDKREGKDSKEKDSGSQQGRDTQQKGWRKPYNKGNGRTYESGDRNQSGARTYEGSGHARYGENNGKGATQTSYQKQRWEPRPRENWIGRLSQEQKGALWANDLLLFQVQANDTDPRSSKRQESNRHLDRQERSGTGKRAWHCIWAEFDHLFYPSVSRLGGRPTRVGAWDCLR